MSKIVNYAVIGVGYFGAELARIVNKMDAAKIVAVYDPNNGEKIAQELSCDNEKNLESLYARRDLDAVIVASPNYLHKEPVVRAAENKLHVFCEKPIALSYGDCDRMVQACEDNGVIFMAGHVMNFFRGVRHAKEMIKEGKIGDVLYCQGKRNGWEEKSNEISWKKIREKSGGHLYHHIHELDCIQFIMGDPETVTMVGGNVAHQGEGFGDEDDLLLINLEFANNTFATLEYGSAFRWPEHYVLIQGTKGAIRLDMKDAKMTYRDEEGRCFDYLLHESKEEDAERRAIYSGIEVDGLKVDGAVMYGKPGSKVPAWLWTIMENEMEYFNNIILGESPNEEFIPLLNGSAARSVIRTADALSLSIKEDRKVKIREIEK